MFPTRVIRKGKRWGRALLVVEAIDCQQREVKRRYRGFVTVVIGIIIIVLLLVFFGRVCFSTCFCIACSCFSCNNLCCDVVHPRCGDCAF